MRRTNRENVKTKKEEEVGKKTKEEVGEKGREREVVVTRKKMN